MVRSLVLGLCAALAWVTTATAGDFNIPFNNAGCYSIFGPVNSIDDPDVFLNYSRCVDLCKATAKDCAKYTKDAASCRNGEASDNRDVERKECDNITDPPTRKSCREAADGTAENTKAQIKADRDEALGLCQSWGDDCLAFCSAE